MLRLDRHILLHLNIVHTLEDRETMSKACHTHIFQFLMSYGYECFSVDIVLYRDQLVFVSKSTALHRLTYQQLHRHTARTHCPEQQRSPHTDQDSTA